MNDFVEDRRSRRAIATWLLLCCGLVYGVVVLGGVTRLTGSGLSMVEWRPVTGVLPPMNDLEWQAEFELYQLSPEYQKVNSHMSVEDFKGIFWLEYLHRLLGRTIGLVFLGGFLIFLFTGNIRKQDTGRYLLMFILGGLQGVLGWYMVKSGLVNNPHVSQYRLTAHLVAAFAIYAYMFWVALGLLFPTGRGEPHRLYGRTLALTGLVTLTVISGGFVAGLKAGFAFNTFPLMNGKWVPDQLFALQPAWRNLFENMVTVQFNHRVLAITVLASVALYWISAMRARLPRRLGLAVHVLLAVTVLQVTLGILTLLLHVPMHLAATHQAVAMLLFTVALYLCHGLRRPGT